MSESIFKIWGERRRIYLDDKTEIDLLYVKKNTFCSTHYHEAKSNKFYVIQGCIAIRTPYGSKILNANESWIVEPPLKHRFEALEDSIMIEMAFVKEGKIDTKDIIREKLGGKIINGEEKTINELEKQGLLEL